MNATQAKPATKRISYKPYFSKFGVERGASYIRINYTSRVGVDQLLLQQAVKGAYDEQSTLRLEYHQLNTAINKIITGEQIADRLNSKSEPKRRAWLAGQVRKCRAARRSIITSTRERMPEITTMQKRQAEIIAEVRKSNASTLIGQKKVASEKRAKEKAALEAGRFWECSEQLLKDYFSVPFDCRKLVSVSEKFRAALFLELEHGQNSMGYNALVPTYNAYLCGIDDNGEEWGFRLQQDCDYNDTVEDAMAVCWEVPKSIVEQSFRQGEILFWKNNNPTGWRTMTPDTEWQIAPSHVITSPSLRHNGGHYFYADDPIIISHPTHAPLILLAGEYQYSIHEVDAD